MTEIIPDYLADWIANPPRCRCGLMLVDFSTKEREWVVCPRFFELGVKVARPNHDGYVTGQVH